jgi:hypothetical protein
MFKAVVAYLIALAQYFRLWIEHNCNKHHSRQSALALLARDSHQVTRL